MIKLYDGQITDLLPEKIAADTDTSCVSYAIMQEHQRLLNLTDRTRTLSVIDELPEKILDILAVELRTPYYQESMNLETKRNIIKRTLLWHTKAGTPSAVSELIEVVFGEGSVVEWFNYDEPPYTPGTFDIITNARMTEEITEYFISIIQRVKNTRSHIRRILIERDMHMDERIATGAVSSPGEAILNHQIKTEELTSHETVAAGISTSPSVVATNHPQGRTESAKLEERVTAGTIGSPHETIGNCASPRTGSISGSSRRAVAMATRNTKTVIFNGAYRASVAVRATQEAAAGVASHSKITITITLTKAAAGNGSYSDGEALTNRTALKAQRQQFGLSAVTTQNKTNVYVKFVMTNKQSTGNLANGYYVKEVGIFATDPDEGEILYALAIAVTDQWDYMPAYNDLLPSTITVDFLTEVANADNVTIEAPNAMYLYDQTTGDKYVLGVDKGLLYYEEVEE